MPESRTERKGWYAGHRVNNNEPVLYPTLHTDDRKAVESATESAAKTVSSLQTLGATDAKVEAVIVPVTITVIEVREEPLVVSGEMGQ